MKRFPFTKRAIEALPAHDLNSPSREAEYTDVEYTDLINGDTALVFKTGSLKLAIVQQLDRGVNSWCRSRSVTLSWK